MAVCTATSGPGAVHPLNGLHDAKLELVPVVAIVARQQFGDGRGNQQEVDQLTLFKDVANEYSQMGHGARAAAQGA